MKMWQESIVTFYLKKIKKLLKFLLQDETSTFFLSKIFASAHET